MVCVAAASGCTERNSTAPDLGFFQIDARTVEALIPFDDFVDEVQVFGGYGSSADVGSGFVAADFNGLNARTIVHLDGYPVSSNQSPGRLTFFDARLVLFFDTITGTTGDVDVEVFEVEEGWHPPSMTWELAVDTAGNQTAWSQPGGGVTTLVGGGPFNIGVGDSLSIPIDSATVARWGEAVDRPIGFLVAGAEPEVFLHLLDVSLRITTSAANFPDNIFEETVGIVSMSYMFDPAPTAPLGWLRVGGTPSWRSVLTMSIPRTIPGTPEVCGAVGCEVDLTKVNLNLAELVLTTRQTEPTFQPLFAKTVDVRPVISPELLPKAPLGEQLLVIPKIIAPELFSTEAGTQVSLSLTALVADALATGALTGTVPVTSVALFHVPEPLTIGFASFEGAGGPGAPALRLLYTIANPVALP
jgi:hypothetical protein